MNRNPQPLKKGLQGKHLGIGCLGVFGLCIFFNLIGQVMTGSFRKGTNSAPTAVSTPIPTPTARADSKYKTKGERVRAGFFDIGLDYGFPCYRKLEEDYKIIGDKRIPKGVQVAIFERCCELEGDAETAIREVRSVVK